MAAYRAELMCRSRCLRELVEKVSLAKTRKNRSAKPGADEGKFIHDDKAVIQIWLTDKSAENLAKLNELGFEVMLDPKTSKLVIGRMPIDKLAALVDLKFVRYVAPQIAGG